MESVWLLLDGGRDAVRRPGLGFLGTSRFAAKTLGFGGWKSLDFLGFSRPNRDLSMGYTRFSEDFFSSRFCRRERAVETAAPRFGTRKGWIVHGGKLSVISDFLQEIAVRALSFRRLHPKANRSSSKIAEQRAPKRGRRGKHHPLRRWRGA